MNQFIHKYIYKACTNIITNIIPTLYNSISCIILMISIYEICINTITHMVYNNIIHNNYSNCINDTTSYMIQNNNELKLSIFYINCNYILFVIIHVCMLCCIYFESVYNITDNICIKLHILNIESIIIYISYINLVIQQIFIVISELYLKKWSELFSDCIDSDNNNDNICGNLKFIIYEFSIICIIGFRVKTELDNIITHRYKQIYNIYKIYNIHVVKSQNYIDY